MPFPQRVNTGGSIASNLLRPASFFKKDAVVPTTEPVDGVEQFVSVYQITWPTLQTWLEQNFPDDAPFKEDIKMDKYVFRLSREMNKAELKDLANHRDLEQKQSQAQSQRQDSVEP